MATRGNTAPNADAVRVKLLDIEQGLNAYFLERSEPLRGMLVGLLARTHVFLIGPPGTAKSLIVSGLTSRLQGARVFRQLMTRFSTPEEVFGPLKLTQLERDIYERNIADMLPDTELAFLDEIFKANSAILNSLLTLLNERDFRNGASVIKTPLLSCVGASNELPQGEDLAALYDRFPLRYFVGQIADDAAFSKLLTLSGGIPSGTTVTLAELQAAQAAVRAITVTDDVLAGYSTLRRELARAGITVSDRRWRESVPIVQACAWLAGRPGTEMDDLSVLAAVLWDKPEQRKKVQDAVLNVACPELLKVLELRDKATEQTNIIKSTKGDTEHDDTTRIEASRKLRKLKDEMTTLSKGSTHPRVVEAASAVAQMWTDTRALVVGK